MKVLGLVFMLLSGSAFAASKSYQVKMDIVSGSKRIASPSVIVREGEMATITTQNDAQKQKKQKSFIEVEASDATISGNHGILMNLTIGEIGKDGKRRIVSRQQILAKENGLTNFTVKDKKGGKRKLKIAVSARRESL